MTSSGVIAVGVVLVGIALIVISRLIQTVSRPPFTWLRRMLDIPVGISLPTREAPGALYYRPYPSRLSLNVPALILGPIWYLLAGLWVHLSIFFSLIFVSGGLLAPFVWVYCGLKANEDLLEFRVGRRSVY